MSFLNELKRRNVFKVAMAYAIMAWIVLQLVNNIVGPLNLPDWVPAFFIVLLAVGFPIVLLTAWAFELTPDGMKRTSEVEPNKSIRQNTGQKINALVIMVLAVAVLYLVFDKYLLGSDEEENPEVASTLNAAPESEASEVEIDVIGEKSIAVLPFLNLSSDPEQEYFSDGLTEELLNKLAQVSDLEVAARTSSFYFKGRNENMREIGEQLQVVYLLEGSVRKSGDLLRITAQLINAASGFHLWSDTYDRQLEDIFVIQDEIAEAVTTALSITLSVGEFDRPGMTTNIEAYNLYLQSRPAYYLYTPESIALAIDYAERAVLIDPDFALGWATLAISYTYALTALPSSQTVDYLNKSIDANNNALALVPDLPEAIATSALLDTSNGNWLETDRKHQLLLDQGSEQNVAVYLSYAMLLHGAGRFQDALPMIQRARRLDPFSSLTARVHAFILLGLNRLEESRIEGERAIALEDTSLNRSVRTVINLSSENRQDVFDFLRNENLEGSPEDQLNEALADILETDAPLAPFLELMDALRQGGIDIPIVFFSLSAHAAAMGEPELALSLLKENPLPGFSNLWWVWSNFYSDVRQLPAFKDYLRDIGLVEYWRASGDWSDYCQPIANTDDFECR